MILDDDYYDHKHSPDIWCGECLKKGIAETAKGIWVGDEAVKESDWEHLADSQTEAYQCDDCLKQNAAYEELGEEL